MSPGVPNRSLVTVAVVVWSAAVLVAVFLGLPMLLTVMDVDVDATNFIAALGSGVQFVGAVVAGTGLFIGWRRALERRSRELRAMLREPPSVRAEFSGEGILSALAVPLLNVDPDGPVPEQLRLPRCLT